MKTLVNISVFGLIPVPPAPDVDPVRVEEDKALTNDDQHHADKLARLRRGLGLGHVEGRLGAAIDGLPTDGGLRSKV